MPRKTKYTLKQFLADIRTDVHAFGEDMKMKEPVYVETLMGRCAESVVTLDDGRRFEILVRELRS